MRALQANDLDGKTIASTDTSAVNVVKITFADGTFLDIWAEQAIHTTAGSIPGFFVEDENGTNA